MYFSYNAEEMNYLKSKNPLLGNYIEKTGFIERQVFEDFFCCLVYIVIGQQISSKTADKIYNKLQLALIPLCPNKILSANNKIFTRLWDFRKKIQCLQDIAQNIITNQISLRQLECKPDEQIINMLTQIKGIGVWSAEMALLFGLKRKNILSYNDFGIRKAIMLLHNKTRFQKAIF